MSKGKGANQYGRYVWMPSEQQRSESKYSARVIRKGLSVKANCDNKDELVADLAELVERLKPLSVNGGELDEKEGD